MWEEKGSAEFSLARALDQAEIQGPQHQNQSEGFMLEPHGAGSRGSIKGPGKAPDGGLGGKALQKLYNFMAI